MSKRLDIFLSETGLAKSREKAKYLILGGLVEVDGRIATKPAQLVEDSAQVRLLGGMKFVGRGGLKLEKALVEFGVSVAGKICMDIGASTGGFSDCLLQNGAAKVYAVDVGTGQLDAALLGDKCIINMEKTDIRNLDKSDFPPINFICIDVSFISLKLVIPKACDLLDKGGEIVALVKPQFEAGKGKVGKNGIVKAPKIHENVLSDILFFCGGFIPVKAVTFSPLLGGDGNIEYLLHISEGKTGAIDVKKAVKTAHLRLKEGQNEAGNIS